MTPYSAGQDVFQTQADSRFNSFADPMNPVNMNPGNWGINSAYMTPSYMSPYRPQYQGPQGNMYGGNNPTWAASANYIANPFRAGGDNYGGNYWQQSTPFYNSFVNRPVDQMASFAQNWAVPAAMGYGAYRMFGAAAGKFGSRVGEGLVGGAAGRFFSAGTAASLGKFGGTVGGLAGNMFLPAAIAQAGIGAFDAGVMDPFVAQRQMSNNLRTNFAGQTFGTGVGDPYQGGGINRSYAAGISSKMSQFASKDLTFNQKEVSQLTDYSARAGLLDTVNPDQFASKMKDITRQVKLVMSVANTSDFKEAIEILGKLQSAGATGNSASRVLNKMNAFAGMGGISTQQLMNTVGMQGQYLFGAAGLTPYVGQLAAGSAYGSMASAYRSGLISPALAARMGGVEGATQSAVSGMLGMASSPYAAMYAHNGYLGGGETGSIVGNVSRFGGNIARGGLSGIGEFNLARPGLISRMTEDRGLQSVQQMIHQLGSTLPGAMRNGKVTAGAAYEMMTKSFGLGDDQARAMLEQIRSYSDPGAVNQMLAGNNRAFMDNRMKFMQQHGADYGRLTPMVQEVLGVGRNIQAGSAKVIGKMLGTTGSVGDYIQNWWNEARFGEASGMQGMNREAFENGGARLNTGNRGRGSSMSGEHRDAMTDINRHAQGGDQDAINAITGTGVQRKDAIYRLAKSGKLGEQFKDDQAIDQLIKSMDAAGTSKGSAKGLRSTLNDMFGGSGIVSGDLNKSILLDASNALLTATEDSQEWNGAKNKLAKVLGKDPGSMSKAEIDKIIHSESVKNLQMNGANAWSGLADKLGVSSQSELDEMARKAGGYDKLAEAKLSGKDLEFYKKNAMQGGDAQAFLAAFQTKDGGKLAGAKLDKTRLDHLSNEDRAALLNGDTVVDKQREFITQMAKDHKIDFATYNQSLSALDNKEAVSAFSDAVSRFSDAVDSSGRTGKKTANELSLQMHTGANVRGGGRN